MAERAGARGITNRPRSCITSARTTRFRIGFTAVNRKAVRSESKAAAIEGEITFRDWRPVAAEEYGYVVADPLDPDIIIGGKLTRFDRRTGQAQNILPVPVQTEDFRMLRTEPVVFSPLDPHLLFFAGNTLWQTRDRGDHWEKISPDLSRPNYELPASIGKYKEDATKQAHRRGVIYTVAPSPLDANRIWCGTDDGLIHLTTDAGKTWSNVTPPNISAWQKISLIEAGHFDANTAYAAVNTLRMDDLRPHIFATHDSGKTWTEIVNGIPAGQIINAVREDPERKGLLFAGAEKGVYVSFDDGANWESLRLNLPATSVRDLIVKSDDLVVATHGRGFWILDNITPLRQCSRRPAGGVVASHSEAATTRLGHAAVQAANRVARSREPEHRHAIAAGRTGRRKSTRWRNDRLFPFERCEWSGHDRDQRRQRSVGQKIFER